MIAWQDFSGFNVIAATSLPAGCTWPLIMTQWLYATNVEAGVNSTVAVLS